MHKELKKQQEVIAIVVILQLKETARSLQKKEGRKTNNDRCCSNKDAVNVLRNFSITCFVLTIQLMQFVLLYRLCSLT